MKCLEKRKKQPEIIRKDLIGGGISVGNVPFELIDATNGVRYIALRSSNGLALTPRLDVDGKPMVATPEEIQNAIDQGL